MVYHLTFSMTKAELKRNATSRKITLICDAYIEEETSEFDKLWDTTLITCHDQGIAGISVSMT